MKKTLALLTGGVEQDVPATGNRKKVDRQTMEGRIATRVENSQAYKKYLQAKSLEGITEYELCDLLYATLESTPETLAKNFEVIVQQLQRSSTRSCWIQDSDADRPSKFREQ